MKKRESNRKLLILGASGFIGSHLLKHWGGRPYLATYLTRPIASGMFFDIARERLRDRILRPGHGFTHAVLAQGLTKLEQCARMRHSATAINVDGTLRAIDDLFEAGVHPIFLSSDAVFDDKPGLRSESDKTNPMLSYGRDKLEVESYLMREAQSWTVLRLTKVIARFADRRNPLSQWLDEIGRRQPISCADDQFLTPVDIEYVTRAILFVITVGAQGIFHIAGSELVTRYELLQRLLARVPMAIRRTAVVRACSIDEFVGIEPLPHNCALSNQKFVSLSGIVPRPLEELCADLSANIFHDPEFALQLGA
jgi:dTDP-4-dehydrorhamnose reductase